MRTLLRIDGRLCGRILHDYHPTHRLVRRLCGNGPAERVRRRATRFITPPAKRLRRIRPRKLPASYEIRTSGSIPITQSHFAV